MSQSADTKLQFGAVEEITDLDDDGSTLTVRKNIRNYVTAKPIHKRYHIRERVHDKNEEAAEIIKFTSSLTDDKLDPEIRIERSSLGDREGWWYVVKIWTELEQ